MKKLIIQIPQELVKSSNNLPLPIQLALEKRDDFVDLLSKIRPGFIRAMRPERKKNLKKFLSALIMSISLQHDGKIFQIINDDWVRPKTLKELAAKAGITYPTAKRCLAFLKQLGFIESTQYKRKNKLGELEVSVGIRAFTPKFWKTLGLWEIYEKSSAWAKNKYKRSEIPKKWKNIINKTNKTPEKVGNKGIKIVNDMAVAANRQEIKDMVVAANRFKNRRETDKNQPINHNDMRSTKARPWQETVAKIFKERGMEIPSLNG